VNAKTILISGASSGLGAAMAREFAARGYHLALCARRTDRLASLCEALSKAHGIRAEALSLDVNEYDQVFTVFREFHRRFGQLDRIVVNAGIGVGRRIGAGRFAENRAAAETNFVAALAQCEAAVEIFRQQNASHLVLISSMSAMRGHAWNFGSGIYVGPRMSETGCDRGMSARCNCFRTGFGGFGIA
jgi:NADP-dependent 3-hydroxy acid dehydrogenase YdfG